MGCSLAIAGVTGAVGQEFLTILEQRDFAFDTLKMLASHRSKGKQIEFKGKNYIVEELTADSFGDVDIALFSAGGGRSWRANDGCGVDVDLSVAGKDQIATALNRSGRHCDSRNHGFSRMRQICAAYLRKSVASI